MQLKAASGFVVEADRQYYLITNRHVVADGARSQAGQKSSEKAPFLLKTSIHVHGGEGEDSAPLFMGMRRRITVALYDDTPAPIWRERQADHQHEPLVDIIALRLRLDRTLQRFSQEFPGISPSVNSWARNRSYWTKISSIPLSAIDTDVDYGPPDAVHVIGYPLGWAPEGPDRSSSAFWRTGFIASEIFEAGTSRPDGFFIDPCAPEGMTGSPVVGLKKTR